jgi:hypothetical protein
VGQAIALHGLSSFGESRLASVGEVIMCRRSTPTNADKNGRFAYPRLSAFIGGYSLFLVLSWEPATSENR